ncbi:MAG: response regulator [Candidatus Omnitrophica bacterium]|nr:response regulator [Candidatus Omnitrophota bacterium]
MKDEDMKRDSSVAAINILLIDDNEADIKISLRAFEKARLKNNVFVVTDGMEALDFLYNRGAFKDKRRSPRPGIILLDINMPKMDGFEVLNRIKADNDLKTIPVVMLTSSKNDEDVLRSYGYGASSYIPKPVIYDEFVKVVDTFNFYWHIVNKLPKSMREESKDVTHRTRILVIDDNPQDQKLLRRLLNQAGFFEVFLEASGEDGIAFVEQQKPEIVLVDTQLTGIDGFETCSKIKKIENYQGKVIIITGLIEAVDAKKAREAGSDAYCAKTRDCAHLLEEIHKILT